MFGLLPPSSKNVRFRFDSPPLAPGSMIPYRDRPMLDTLAGTEIRESTSDLLKMMVSVLEDINRGEGTLGKLLKNPELYDNLSSFTASMAQTSRSS